MSSNTKKLIILAVIIMLLAGFMSMVCGFSSLGFSFLNRNTSRGGAKTFQVSGSFSSVEIESQTGNIRFHDAGKNPARVVWSGSSTTKLSVRNQIGTLKVKEQYRLPWIFRIGIVSGKSEIDVYLPRQDYKRLTAESDTGNISVPAGLSFSEADIDTDTGTVEFQADVQKTLKIDTDTGRISCSGSKPENLNLESDTGAVNVSAISVSKDIRVKTDTGRITLTNVTTRDKMKLESDTGSISLERCDAAELDIETDTGSISGTLLSEKIFNAKSGTGRVDVPESAFGGECKIKTDTGSITIRIEK